jgi:hypothetical protein
MKTHTTLGRDAIEHAERQLGTDVEFLKMAKEIACRIRRNGMARVIRRDWAVRTFPCRRG